MKTTRCFQILLLAVAAIARAHAADKLAAGFENPPFEARPSCYWYWLNGNISREGITRDLESMSRVGIGEAFIGNIFLTEMPAGPVQVLSEEWWSLVAHAIAEGDRTGVKIGMFNCPGWSQSGGPWINPGDAMRHLVSNEFRATGPRRLELPLPAPGPDFQRVMVQGFPAPAEDAETWLAQKPQVSVAPAIAGAEAIIDGDRETTLVLPHTLKSDDRVVFDFDLAAKTTVRSLSIFPGSNAFGARVGLWAIDGDAAPVRIREFTFDRSKSAPNVGPMPRGPVTVSFPEVTARKFRLEFSGFFTVHERPEIAEIELSGAARLESYIEKQLGKMHQTPLPMWDAYEWSAQAAPESEDMVVSAKTVRDLTPHVGPDGVLRWDVPAGEWVIVQTGMRPTGVVNGPSAPEARGLEVDKMNREKAQAHFDSFIGELLRRIPAEKRRAFTSVIADSYETGSQNWTDGFEKVFEARFGYDARAWLPVLTGRIVGSVDESNRFLWDLRRLVADRVATEYVGGMSAAARVHNMGLWLENYGHWGFPGEFLRYGAESDRIGGEYWVTGTLGSIECRAASSAASIYGKRFVSAEAFTGGPPFQNLPRALKARGDWSFCEGVNHLVLHVYIHQPWEKPPGVNAWFGTEFNRLNTWFEESGAWVDYVRRCSWMLQQGARVADVAYFIGDDAPKMTGIREPELPAGYDFDYINSDVIERELQVRNGGLELQHGASYRVLVLPPSKTMRPSVLAKILELVRAGATVVGAAVESSPSLQDFPSADREVKRLARELWGDEPVAAKGDRTVGNGRVVWGKPLAEILEACGSSPDFQFVAVGSDARFLYTHRHSTGEDIYFVTNQGDRAESATLTFRSHGRVPELWNAVTGEHGSLPGWKVVEGRIEVPMEFEANQSWFVVFREESSSSSSHGMNLPPLTGRHVLEGPWNVEFSSAIDSPEPAVFPELTSWTDAHDPRVRHHSGSATYTRQFSLPEPVRSPGSALWLDLGEVRDMAKVTVNGKIVGTVWTAPWRIDISAAVKDGENLLEVTVFNPWNNRLVGEATKPRDERATFLSTDTVAASDELLPAGLLGPVSLRWR